MARLIYAAQGLADLERLMDFLVVTDPASAAGTVELIPEAVRVLKNHPLIGCLAEHNLRELVISRGKSGCLAMYSYEEEENVVLVLAIRHQRETGDTQQ